MTPATTASRAPPRGTTPVLAFGLGLLSVGPLSGGHCHTDQLRNGI